ncbi:hypothetical protein AAKU67_004213 [Oxalobacteraceae bacterium GrIS 2.11]
MHVGKEQFIYKSSFLFVLFIVALFASAYGILEPDSHGYIAMAKSLQSGRGCLLEGQYNAVEPCGYSAVIATVDTLTGLGNLITASKIANLVLLLGSFIFLLKTIKNLSLATLFFINPISFYTYTYTLSESLFLFVFCGVFYWLNRMRDVSSTKLDVLYLSLFLVIGCFSRYFFGPFCCVIWLCALAVFGRRFAIRALPGFIVAAIVYVGYQKFNLMLTGFPTGMQRMPAPESPLYLTIAFLVRVSQAFLILFLMVFLYKAIAGRNLRILKFNTLLQNLKNNASDFAPYKFLLFSGIGFLLLSFLIRMFYCFDLFDFRIIGYGVIFTSIALLGLGDNSGHWGSWKSQSVALILIGILSVIPTQKLSNWKSIFETEYKSPQQLIANSHSAIHNKTIFSFGLPQTSKFISADDQYYDSTSLIVHISTGPSYPTENFDSFVAKVKKYANDDCVFDFSVFENKKDFETEVVDSAYPVALDFSKSVLKPGRVTVPAYDPEIGKFLMKVYRPKSVIACSEILAQI